MYKYREIDPVFELACQKSSFESFCVAGKKPFCKKEEDKIEIVELSEHASVEVRRIGVYFLHFRSALDVPSLRI